MVKNRPGIFNEFCIGQDEIFIKGKFQFVDIVQIRDQLAIERETILA